MGAGAPTPSTLESRDPRAVVSLELESHIFLGRDASGNHKSPKIYGSGNSFRRVNSRGEAEVGQGRGAAAAEPPGTKAGLGWAGWGCEGLYR